MTGSADSKRPSGPTTERVRFRPSEIGRLLTFSKRWDLWFSGDQVTVEYGGRTTGVSVRQADEISIRKGAFWTTIRVRGVDAPLRATRHKDGAAVAREFVRMTRSIRLDGPVAEALTWWRAFDEHRSALGADALWFTEEQIQAVESAQWKLSIRQMDLPLGDQEYIRDVLGEEAELATRWAVSDRTRDLADLYNRDLTESELVRRVDFFRTIEKSPLTLEQSKAVICFDNRVEVIAAAGSGKTATMVAKAGYALMRGLVRPERILMLAFNRAAADELLVRTQDRLEAAGLDSAGVEATTFHSFGLRLIGEATGAKPRLAPGLDHQNGIPLLAEIVHELRKQPAFNDRWLTFRAVYGAPVRSQYEEELDPDAYDSKTSTHGFETMSKVVVRSSGERKIANWLTLNGIAFKYEQPYKYPTATATHSQYCPDFYYPDAQAYHEHWAFVRPDRLPASFAGYHESRDWKLDLHRNNNTDLIETKAADIADDTALEHLREELAARGVVAQPRTEIVDQLKPPLNDRDLLMLLRTFLVHAKSNRLTMSDLRSRVERRDARATKFLEMYEIVRDAWDARLRDTETVDFEDMLNLATDIVEQGQYRPAFDLVMVDEFQDTSHARAALVKALVGQPHKHLFAVGDDWQSIYRFAGSDISVMTDFEAFYGRGHILRLQETFRSTQRISDVAARFVAQNPKQLAKEVSGRAEPTTPPHVIVATGETDMQAATMEVVASIPREEQILVLGRYNTDRKYAPKAPNVQFLTVHRSKGLEADHVIVVNVTTRGFPSSKEDDPLLQLAMPAGDTFEFAEERRLFYVALTRAKTSVTLITASGRQSAFLRELIESGDATVEGDDVASAPCPECDSGFLVERTSEFGVFYGCNRFPACIGKAKYLPQAVHQIAPQRAVRRTHARAFDDD